jgi:hypothetical protein
MHNKKIGITIVFAIISYWTVAQNQNTKEFEYRLYPTENNFNFIKLNTSNGQMTQVQYSVEDIKRFEVILSTASLVKKEDEIKGRFTLYPTKNIWTFILLDQIDGNTWQVQWSFNPEQRAVIPIESSLSK